ncbi:MAG: glucose 1-dehydrogenase [Haloferacaceae archaeon]
MKAVAIRRGEARPTVVERPRPEPAPGEALVRTLRVGVDGTDREIIAGAHGGFPAGENCLVLGHEAVGVVVESRGSALTAGDVVVPTVRRPPPSGSNEYFDRGEPDMAPPDATVERGIAGAHGFMADLFTSPEEYLVRVPRDAAEYGFLVEPMSVSEKAFEHAFASRSAFDWRPESAVVLGNGPLGLVTLAMLSEFDRRYCLGRRDQPDPSIDVVERLGATYVDSRETPVDELADAFEPMDFVYEATGHARHAFEAIDALAPNGVAALLGVPDSWSFEVDGGRLHRELVMTNKALVGSVNAGRRHFEAAVETLDALPEWLPGALVDDVFAVDDAAAAFGDERTMKAAVEFGTL